MQERLDYFNRVARFRNGSPKSESLSSGVDSHSTSTKERSLDYLYSLAVLRRDARDVSQRTLSRVRVATHKLLWIHSTFTLNATRKPPQSPLLQEFL